jgi:hypothetical protein
MLMLKQPIRSIFLCVLLAAPMAFAAPQQTQGDTRPIARETPALAQRLALSRDQRVQFHAINQDRKAQLEAVKADATLSPSARKQKVKEIHAETETKIRAMLNQNQLQEYDQIKRERREEALRKRETTVPPTAAAAPRPQ